MRLKEVWPTIPEDIQLEIEMKLYEEFNDVIAMMEEWRGEIFTQQDITDMKRLKAAKKKELVKEYLRRQIWN